MFVLTNCATRSNPNFDLAKTNVSVSLSGAEKLFLAFTGLSVFEVLLLVVI